ncbi:MAG: sigma-54 dependent transcriptional regulator [Candidatus Acidoferrales bacterium]
MSPRKARKAVGIVEDDVYLRRAIAAGLRGQFTIVEAEDYEGAYQLLEEATPDILLLSLQLPPGGLKEGVRLIQEIEKNELDTIVIVMSDNPEKSVALKVMEAGAYDYFTKPVDLDVLRVILDRAVEKQQIERENRILREEFFRQQSFGDLVGSSPPMQEVYDAILRVADSAATIIIRGESGTGKELVAHSIHEHSSRSEQPFVSVNCAALPETLIESELFGYEKGAFTGATTTKEGRFELANRGTLFLDEIGTLTLALQAKLLRVLDEREFVRLGGKKSVKVDIRLITATNENLEDRMGKGEFREDLYYRICVVPISIPPLRERVDDIRLLVNYFLQVHCAANGLALKQIEEAALQALERYAWPGNVRELENVVQRMVLMSEGSVIRLKDLPSTALSTPRPAHTNHFRMPTKGIELEQEVADYERQWLQAALAQAGGVKTQAARLLGLNKDRMKYLCRKYGL